MPASIDNCPNTPAVFSLISACLVYYTSRKEVCVCVCVCVCFFVFCFCMILYVICFGRTMLYMCLEYHIQVNMYHVSTQGVDERMINVHYYYYY